MATLLTAAIDTTWINNAQTPKPASAAQTDKAPELKVDKAPTLA
jgi:hypothetical protein